MNDRLRDLGRVGSRYDDDMDQIELNEVLDKDLENAEGGVTNGQLIPEASKFLDSFYCEVTNVKRLIDNIAENTEIVEREYKRIESSTQNEKVLRSMYPFKYRFSLTNILSI
jgi:hypothetical protein